MAFFIFTTKTPTAETISGYRGLVMNNLVGRLFCLLSFIMDHGGGSTDHFSALKIWMFENKFVSLPSHLKTIEPMEVHRGAGTMCNTKTSKVISRNPHDSISGFSSHLEKEVLHFLMKGRCPIILVLARISFVVFE
jgi:hypothetical protein